MSQILNSFDLERKNMYIAFDDYFNHPIMVKIKDVNGYSVYITKVYCLPDNKSLYIIIFILADGMSIRTRKYLRYLEWDNLQTRILNDYYNLPLHYYQRCSLDVRISRILNTGNKNLYDCDAFPNIVIFTPIENNNDISSLTAALEMYNTMISLT